MDTLALNRSEDQKVYFSTHTLAGDTTEALLRSAQLDWEYLSSPVKYDTAQGERVNDNSVVLYRSDNLDPVATVSNRFKPVQPKELVDFYLNLSRAGHYQLDALGCVGGGSKIWGLAKGTTEFRIQGQDVVEPYLFFATGNDGNAATQIKIISKRRVCNNQLDATLSEPGRWKIVIPHSTTVDFDAITKRFTELPGIWSNFEATSNVLADQTIEDKKAFEIFYQIYVNKDDSNATIEKKTTRMMELYKYHPTQQLRSTQKTAWGVVNAVTLYEDHLYGNSKTSDASRFKSAMMGPGEKRKAQVWELVQAA